MTIRTLNLKVDLLNKTDMRMIAVVVLMRAGASREFRSVVLEVVPQDERNLQTVNGRLFVCKRKGSADCQASL